MNWRLAVPAALLFSLGVAPLLGAGVADIGKGEWSEIAVTNTLLALFLALALAVGAVWRHLQVADHRLRYAGLKLAPLAITAVVIAGLAVWINLMDSGNSSAWRNANKFSAAETAATARLREFGRHFLRVEVENGPSTTGLVGRFPQSWTAWVSGGTATLLVRNSLDPRDDTSSNCTGNLSLSLAAERQNRQITAVDAALCRDWQRVTLAFPAGTDALTIEVPRSRDDISVDLMLLDLGANYAGFWRASNIIGLSLLLILVYYVVQTGVDPSRHADRDPTPAQTRIGITSGALAVFLLLGNLFVYSYVSQERTIYSWDFAGYWTSSINVSQFLKGGERKSASTNSISAAASGRDSGSVEPSRSDPDPGAGIALLRNFRHAEYNVSTNLPVAPVLALFGGSRLVYELALFNIYAVAAVLMLIVALAASKRRNSASWPVWWPLIPVLVMICCVPFWIPILRGYMGVSILGINFAVLWIYFRRPLGEHSLFSLTVVGALLLAGVILQRWNAYWVVAFLVAAFCDGMWHLVTAERRDLAQWLKMLRVPAVSGFAAFFLFASIAWPKLVTTITTDYADIYSAYLEDDSRWDALAKLVSAFGGLFTALFMAIAAYLFIQTGTRRIAAVLCIQLVVIFVHFTGTQTFGPHQTLMLVPGIFMLLSLGIAELKSSASLTQKRFGATAIGLVLLSGLASSNAAFRIQATPPPPPTGIGIFSQSYRPPLYRNDIDEFISLAKYVDENLPDMGKLYVAAGSQTLNSAHFENIGLSTNMAFTLAEAVLSSSVVDKRDGFPRGLLSADLVVTSQPIQFSRNPSDQHVIRIPAESLMAGQGVGAAFRQLPETFVLQGGVRVLVFARYRGSTEEEVADLQDKLRKIYPDRPDVYR